MKTIKLTKVLVMMFILTVFACSKDDDGGGGNMGINAQNLVTTFDENPTNGQTVGTVQAVGGGTLSFSISSQTPAGALNINPSTGELTVANSTAFDFETNPIVTANISIIDAMNTATATATINLNDVDDIESFLSTSQAAYTAASDGDWVMITEGEYNALALSLNETSKVATSDADYTSSEITNSSSANFTAANNNGETMLTGSYIFAFKYHAMNAGITSNKVKQSSTSISDGYMDIGGTFPSSIVGENYMVLKGSNTPTTNSGFLAIYQSDTMGVKTIAGNSYNYYNTSPDNDSNTLPNSITSGGTFLYQGLSTTQKQW